MTETMKLSVRNAVASGDALTDRPVGGSRTADSARVRPAGVQVPHGSKDSKRARLLRNRRALAYLFLLPALLAITVVQLIPMVSGIAMSLIQLTQYTIGDWLHAPFTWSNYRIAFSGGDISASLLVSFLVTLAYTAFVLLLSWVFGIAGATLLSDGKRNSKVFRALFILPYAIPAFASIMAWTTMFQSNGAVNTLFGHDLHLYGGNVLWAAGGRAFWAMAITGLWRSWPFAFLMLLAAVQSIPSEIYEAATVDGANRWQVFLRITLPNVRAVSGIVLLTLGFWTFNDFATPFLMFGTAAPSSANIISTEIYSISFTNLNFGLGAAMSVGVIAFLIIVIVFYIRFMRQELKGVFDAQ